MSVTVDELLQALHAGVAGKLDVSSLTDAIEALVEAQPEDSRKAIHAYTGDERLRLWALGLLGDPRDFPVLAAGLADPELRSTALEALAGQPDATRVDEIARSFLDDADPMVRSRAVRMVAFSARPGALAVLSPLAQDPIPHVRMILGWCLGGLGDQAAEPTLRTLLADPDEQVRAFAAHGLRRLNRP
ncbi:HEAT repeat domain-containing protein [Hamadaea sp. NPDC051192]|uniref:HEAT repeat domain-containing protein n=1 Tax=Hamadaea sp. NPDC051192 TaxID=3154940 RepID=UPI003421F489